ncbi:hypothetical protein ACIPN8_03950 [Streptomyces sp. NPDC086082]|uniref:hypothetical protein n=1 Tax=Streptomyces sp. NPDC086082 TaxID=3365750 RepID=UPI00382A5D0A
MAMGEANSTAAWGNYATLGYRRLVYTSTVSVLDACLSDDRAPVDTIRVVTDGRSVVDIAEDVLAATGWANRP